MMINYDHLPYLGFLLAEIAVSLLVGAILFFRCSNRLPAERLSLLIAPAAIVVSLTLAAFHINSATDNPWSGARMIPAIGLFHGAKMYVGPDGPGAIMNTIYPPLSYLAYIPSALFANPTWSILIGSTISLLLYMAPALVLALWPPKNGDGNFFPLMGVVCALAFFQLTIMSKAMIHVAFQIHADAPTFAFVGLACMTLYRNRGEVALPNSSCFISALFGAMAVWSKQTSMTMVAALPLWILLNHGFRATFRFTFYLAAMLGAFLLLFATTLGLKTLKFNLLDLPSSHPWYYQGSDLAHGLLVLGTDYFCYVAAVLAVLLLALLARNQLTPGGDSEVGGWRRRIGENPWLLFVLVGLAAAPLSLLSRIKIGGYWCNYAPTPYFLAMALIAVLMEWYETNLRRGFKSFNAHLALIVLILVLAPLTRGAEGFAVINAVRDPMNNQHEQAYRYLKRHPGMAYFPWLPMSHLRAEGKIYHLEYGMSDRELGGFHVSPDHFRRNTPANFRYVCYFGDPPPPLKQTMRYLPDFTRRVEIPELPGWTCYER